MTTTAQTDEQIDTIERVARTAQQAVMAATIAVEQLRREQTTVGSRAIALAATKLDEARLWLAEAERLWQAAPE